MHRRQGQHNGVLMQKHKRAAVAEKAIGAVRIATVIAGFGMAAFGLAAVIVMIRMSSRVFARRGNSAIHLRRERTGRHTTAKTDTQQQNHGDSEAD